MKTFSQLMNEATSLNPYKQIHKHIDKTIAHIGKQAEQMKGDASAHRMLTDDKERYQAVKSDMQSGEHKAAARTYWNGETGCRDHAFDHSKENHAAFRAYLDKHSSQ